MAAKLKRNNRQPRPAKPFEVTTIEADQRRVNQVTSATRRRLLAGESMRCACCVSWQLFEAASIGVYLSPSGDATGYVLCPKCAQLVTVSESARRRVAAYVAGIN